MDAVTVNVVWMVIWFLMIWGFPALGFGLGSAVAIAIDQDWAAVFVFVGWAVGIGLGVFSVVQTILHVISLVQLLTT